MQETQEFKQGYAAYGRTFNKANPYPPGSPESERWERGYLEAMMDNAI